jgi:hypothetical protein
MSPLTATQSHAFGVIGGVAFGLERRALVKLAKELAALGLVTTGGAYSGQNRSVYHWDLTGAGQALFAEMVNSGKYPLAGRTSVGRAILELET